MNWETQTTHDNGNGSIVHVSLSRDWPNVKMIEVVGYSRGMTRHTHYEAIDDPDRIEFFTPKGAAERHEQLKRERDQSEKIRSLEKKLAAKR